MRRTFLPWSLLRLGLGVVPFIGACSSAGTLPGERAETRDSVSGVGSVVLPFRSGMQREDFDFWDIPRYDHGRVAASPRDDERLVRNERDGDDVYLVVNPRADYREPPGGCHAEVQLGKGPQAYLAEGDDFTRNVSFRMRIPSWTPRAESSWRSLVQLQNYSRGPYLFRPAIMLWLAGGADNRTLELRFPTADGQAANYDATLRSIRLDDGGWHRIELELVMSTTRAGRVVVRVDGEQLEWFRVEDGAREGWAVNRPTLYAPDQRYALQLGAYTYFKGRDTETEIHFDDLVVEGHD